MALKTYGCSFAAVLSLDSFGTPFSHHESTLKQLVYHERPTVARKESDIVNLPWNGSQSNGGLIRTKLEYVGHAARHGNW
jgi:hypothetical protein